METEKSKRTAIPKKTRFEVFKRDSFTCQYCGSKSPDVVLVVDHIDPVARGGKNQILNLVTSCDGCNSGKGATPLSDQAALAKQRAQLDALQERREQLRLMMEWQRGLIDIEKVATVELGKLWKELVPGWYFNDAGLVGLHKLVKRHGVAEVAAAMRESVTSYLEFQDNKPTADSVQKASEYIGRIIRFKQSAKDKPYMREVLYVRAIVRNRYTYCVDWKAKDFIEKAYLAGYDFDTLKDVAKNNASWSSWQSEMQSMIDSAREAG